MAGGGRGGRFRLPHARPRASVGVLGKLITRRARSVCELCGSKADLRLYELAPYPEEPTEDRALLACGRCRGWLDDEQTEVMAAHFLSGAVWNELPAVRLAAGRMLLAVRDADDPWIEDALEASGIDRATAELASDAEV